MKKLIPVIVFILVFVGVYCFISFGISGMRIKLAAEPAVYFWESIKHAMPFKAITSAVAGGIFSGISHGVLRKIK